MSQPAAGGAGDVITMRPEDAIRVSGLGRTTMYALLRKGDIRSVKVGRARLVDAESLRDYLATGGPTTDA